MIIINRNARRTDFILGYNIPRNLLALPAATCAFIGASGSSILSGISAEARIKI